MRKGLWVFFLGCAFRVLIGWAGKLWSRGVPWSNRSFCRTSVWNKVEFKTAVKYKILVCKIYVTCWNLFKSRSLLIATGSENNMLVPASVKFRALNVSFVYYFTLLVVVVVFLFAIEGEGHLASHLLHFVGITILAVFVFEVCDCWQKCVYACVRACVSLERTDSPSYEWLFVGSSWHKLRQADRLIERPEDR